MIYREGSPSVRKYDTCYYDILPGDDLTGIKSKLGLRIFLKIKNNKNLNVYLYGGRDRYNAVESIISGNKKAELNTNYTVDVDDGFLIVAYPDENVPTEFEFEYWVADLSEDLVKRIEDLNFAGKDGETLLAVILLVTFCILLFFCCCAYVVSK